MTTLVFPALNQMALEYLESARRRGERVVGASSVYDAAAEAAFGELALLPYVYDESFKSLFLSLLAERGITHIYSPVVSVFAFLEGFITAEKLPITLLGTSPINQQVEAYKKLRQKAEDAHRFISHCSGHAANTLSVVDVAAIFRHANLVYGESNDEKLAAMMAIFASAPKGDVVEIGSLMGKSLCVLQYLAKRYNTGCVLSIDPLTAANAVQKDSPEIIKTTLANAWDFDVLREAFAVNMLPVGLGTLNFLRMGSEEGYAVYCKQNTISSEPFGAVTYTGKIAVIHIDGNHDYAQVNIDCELWLQKLVPGAWVILDDYLWAHGDGPHRVGNALLEKRRNDIERSFECGKALFIKFR